MRNTLICTVGTSFLFNISKLDEATPLRQTLDQIKNKTQKNSENWKALSLELLNLENTNRICGAEINSITSIWNEGLLDRRDHLLFLVSETDDGKNTGEILKQYYSHSRNPLKFEHVEFKILKGLRDNDVQAFQQQGLKNLVIEISSLVQKSSADTIAINATGGYKAQISFAGMIGQALGIPVYYLFEKFSKVIKLPPQPVALDLGLWLENYSLFEVLELEKQVEKDAFEAKELDIGILESMLDYEEIDRVDYVSLSAMGQLFHDRCRLQFPQQETVLLKQVPQDDTPAKQKQIALRDDHGNDVLQKFAEKLQRSPYVKGIVNSLPFNPKRRNCIRRVRPNGTIEFILTWTDEGLGLCIATTGRTLAETTTIALHLKEKYSQ